MLKLASRVGLILAMITSCLVTYMVRAKNGEEFYIQNFRAIFNHANINTIIQSLAGNKGLSNLATVDDPGFSIMLSLATFISGKGPVSPGWTISDFPLLYVLGILLFHFLALTIVFTSRAVGEQMKVPVFIFFLFPISMAVFTGFDVYLFPIYAMCFSFVILYEIRLEKVNYPKMICLSLLIGLCEMMRSGSGLFLSLTLIFFFIVSKMPVQRKFTSIAILFLPYFMVKNLPYLFFHRSGHTFWHAVHAGMFEFGGCVGKNGETWPFFIFPQEEVKDKALAFCKEGWDDVTQNLVAQLNGVKEVYTPEYDQVMKAQTLDLLGSHFFSFVSLIIERLVRIFSFSPYMEYGRSGTVNMDFGVVSFLWGISCLTLTAFALYKQRKSEIFQLLGIFLLLAMAPPLLVHSGYIIYNLPVYFVITLIWFMSLTTKKEIAHE